MSDPAPNSMSRANCPLPPARVRVRPQPPSTAQTQTDDAPAPCASGDYEIGYGRPPRANRFRPGQSGNPRGRPKGGKGLNTIVRESLTQKVAVRTANGEKRISRIEAVMHKTVELAMKGNPRALAELLRLYGNAVPDEKKSPDGQHHEDGDLTAADLAILETFTQEMAGSREAGHEA